MHKSVLTLAGIGAALASAAPAAAQYYSAPPVPRYGYGYGNWQEVRELHARIDGIRRQIDWLDRRDAIDGRMADRLLDKANRIDRRLSDRARGGLDPREAGEVRYRIQQLEAQVHWARSGRPEGFFGWR